MPLPEGGAAELLTPLPAPGRPPVRGAAPPPGEAVLGVVSLGAPTQPPIPPAAVRGAEPGRAGSSSPPHCSLLAGVQRPLTLLLLCAVLLQGRRPLPPAGEERLVWPGGRLGVARRDHPPQGTAVSVSLLCYCGGPRLNTATPGMSPPRTQHPALWVSPVLCRCIPCVSSSRGQIQLSPVTI
ncbi:hypothetical protein E2C01_018255 [Portunus trituberculatus]|uniref:Uncharacterized protein n=1 Tax=Portunus trituberculatus TaxID=210409 RepID=A0A5B7DVX5_PORTR|nr:hypothetical protein [Portunus trituberculatus]